MTLKAGNEGIHENEIMGALLCWIWNGSIGPGFRHKHNSLGVTPIAGNDGNDEEHDDDGYDKNGGIDLKSTS